MGKGILGGMVVLALAPAAEGKIVPQKSIAGVALGMSKAAVLEHEGKPLQRIRTEEGVVWVFPKTLRVGFDRRAKGVTFLSTRSRRQRTASGIGPGSTRAQVRKALKGEHCSPSLCLLGDGRHRSYSTYFVFGVDQTGPVEYVEVRYELLDGMA